MTQNTFNDFDKDFELEEKYLKNVYAQMLRSQKELSEFIGQAKTEGLNTISRMSEDIRVDFSTLADNVDTLATIEMKNREIDQMNARITSSEILLENVKRSLQSPYFGKITVNFLDGQESDLFYIGIYSFGRDIDEKLVYDWRSPIAELFYNNEMGHSSYEVNQNVIDVNIDNRRQFVIEKDKLIRFFDTSVAIQDDVLLEALEQDSSSMMQDITATIQKEQNVIIRDMSHPILLVDGVAGSGKTSTIMQRIAYLLYNLRTKITSDNILILSPNEHFVEYISNVLPSLGERTPLNLTLRQFLSNLMMFPIENEAQYFNRISQEEVDQQTQVLRSEEFIHFIDSAESLLVSNLDFFRPILRKEKVIISTEKVLKAFNETPDTESLIHRVQATGQLLMSQWEQRLAKQSKNPKIFDRILSLPESLQIKFFGEEIKDDSTQSLSQYALKYLKIQYGQVSRDIASMEWLDITALFKKLYYEYTQEEYVLFNESECNVDEAVIILYVYNHFIEKISMHQMKFILVDEVQDYSSAQILLLNRLFPKSEFTMVGDENQAIFNSNITFDKILSNFGNREDKTQLYHLANSYRSSGAITKFLSQLAINSEKWEIVPIRPDGSKPSIRHIQSKDKMVGLLSDINKKIEGKKLTIITKTQNQSEELIESLGNDLLQSLNIEVVPISLSKGLEFDHVLIHQVTEENYSSQRDQRILYTAASRAMRKLYITFSDTLSTLISSDYQ